MVGGAIDPKVPEASGKERDLDADCASYQDFLSIKDWDEFYRKCRKTCDPELLAELIIRRLQVLALLSEPQCRTLRTLLNAEHAAAAQQLLQEFTTAELGAVLQAPEEVQAGHAEAWRGLSRILDRVHRWRDRDYAAAFDATPLSLINDHLRNSRTTLCTEYRRDRFGRNLGGDRYWVVGIGPSWTGKGGGNLRDGMETEWRQAPAAGK